MMKSIVAVACMLMFVSGNLSAQRKSLEIRIENPADRKRDAVLIKIDRKVIQQSANDFNVRNFSVWNGNQEISSQYNASSDEIVFVLDLLNARQKLSVTLYYEAKGEVLHQYPKRTQAELSHKAGGQFVNREYVGGSFKNVEYLRVPPEHKDHSWFIRYEGPGWESDKVGYRFYLDQRNATDVFGKLTTDMVLQGAGQDGFDSYHELQSWGMDIMKVGKSLGLGSIGTLANGKIERVEKTDSVTCRIVENGPVYSAIHTNYFGWQAHNQKADIRSELSIHAGTRLTTERLTIKGDLKNISTGIVKDNLALLMQEKGSREKFGYLATWGKQSLNKDELGLAVFFSPADFVSFEQDEFSNIVQLKAGKQLTYYFLAAWVKEPGGIQSEAAFREYVENTAKDLAIPVNVTVGSSIKK